MNLFILKSLWIYLFRSKEYPVFLYNTYGSEGEYEDRISVDNLIDRFGFWKAVRMIYKRMK
jgi:hypothetical protein